MAAINIKDFDYIVIDDFFIKYYINRKLYMTRIYDYYIEHIDNIQAFIKIIAFAQIHYTIDELLKIIKSNTLSGQLIGILPRGAEVFETYDKKPTVYINMLNVESINNDTVSFKSGITIYLHESDNFEALVRNYKLRGIFKNLS